MPRCWKQIQNIISIVSNMSITSTLMLLKSITVSCFLSWTWRHEDEAVVTWITFVLLAIQLYTKTEIKWPLGSQYHLLPLWTFIGAVRVKALTTYITWLSVSWHTYSHLLLVQCAEVALKTWPYSTSAFAVCSIWFPCCFMTLTSASVTFWSSSSFAIRHNNQVWQKRRMIVLIRFLDKNFKKSSLLKVSVGEV